jgi:hypothetical protein
MRSGSLLCSDLNNPVISARRINHPASLFDEECQRLLYVNIFARGTRHDGHERVPVIRRRDDYGLQIFVVQELPKISVGLGGLPACCDALFESWLIDVAHGGQIHIFLIAKVVNVLAAYETEADEADLDPFICAENSAVRSGS